MHGVVCMAYEAGWYSDEYCICVVHVWACTLHAWCACRVLHAELVGMADCAELVRLKAWCISVRCRVVRLRDEGWRGGRVCGEWEGGRRDGGGEREER